MSGPIQNIGIAPGGAPSSVPSPSANVADARDTEDFSQQLSGEAHAQEGAEHDVHKEQLTKLISRNMMRQHMELQKNLIDDLKKELG